MTGPAIKCTTKKKKNHFKLLDMKETLTQSKSEYKVTGCF